MGCFFTRYRSLPQLGVSGMLGTGYGRGPGQEGMGYGGRYWENWELFLLLFNWLHKKAITIYKIDWLHKIIVNNCFNDILNFLKN